MEAPGETEKLLKRSDFLRCAASGFRVSTHSMLVQAAPPPLESSPALRLGFTATKKLGNAVARNRAKRRMRHAVRDAIRVTPAPPALDFVFIARPTTLTAEYDVLVRDAAYALRKLPAMVAEGKKAPPFTPRKKK